MKRAASAPPSFLGSPSFLGAAFGSGEPSGGVRTAKLPGDPGTGQSPLAMTSQPGYGPEGSSAAAPGPGAALIGGGFLQSAAMTAAGIAGGALLFEGIRSIFGHEDSLAITGNQPVTPNLGEAVLRNRKGAEAGASGGGNPPVVARHRKGEPHETWESDATGHAIHTLILRNSCRTLRIMNNQAHPHILHRNLDEPELDAIFRRVRELAA